MSRLQWVMTLQAALESARGNDRAWAALLTVELDRMFGRGRRGSLPSQAVIARLLHQPPPKG